MSSAFCVVFCFPFFLVSNNIGRAGCKPSPAGLEEGLRREREDRERHWYVYILPGISLKSILASKVVCVACNVKFFSAVEEAYKSSIFK